MRNKFVEVFKEKKYLWKIIIIVALIVVDLVTKAFMASFFGAGNNAIDIFGGLVTFTYIENTGAAFGSFASSTTILTIISIVFVIVFLVVDYFQKRQTKLYLTGICLIIAGAMGNFVDRLFLGYVRDFIRFSMFNFVCNIADILICVGVGIYLLDMVIVQFKDKRAADDRGEDSSK